MAHSSEDGISQISSPCRVSAVGIHVSRIVVHIAFDFRYLVVHAEQQGDISTHLSTIVRDKAFQQFRFMCSKREISDLVSHENTKSE